MSDLQAHITRHAIRANLRKWVAAWLESDEHAGRLSMFFYSHGDDRIPEMPAGKRAKVTFELEDDPNAVLLQEHDA